MERDDAAERRGVEGGAADERAVDVGLRHERVDVVGLHAATVQDPDGVGTRLAGEVAEEPTDRGVHFLGLLGGGGLSGADGPHGLIGEGEGADGLT